MGKERTLYESESQRSISEVIDFLQQLAGWLSEGRLAFDEGGEQVVVEIPGSVVLEIKLEEEDKGKKGVERSLEVEIEWKVAREAVAAQKPGEEAPSAAEAEIEEGSAAIEEKAAEKAAELAATEETAAETAAAETAAAETAAAEKPAPKKRRSKKQAAERPAAERPAEADGAGEDAEA